MSSGDVLLARALEAGGKALLRTGDVENAQILLSHALLTLTLNKPKREYRCNVDESAGMAEVVELHGYSRKAPCA